MKNSTDITFVLDRSGSMASVKSDTIGGFNTFLDDQKKVPLPATFTLVQFDGVYEFVCNGINLNDAKPLTDDTFVPRGSTALLDAIGRAINETGKRLAAMPEVDRPDKVLFVIQTDGQENASKEFNAARINAMITEQRDKWNWQFVFLGANQDAITSAAAMGIQAASSMTYAANAAGTSAAYAAVSRGVTSLRAGGQCVFTEADREDQAAAGAV